MKKATSQLALLSERTYRDGLAKIRAAIANARARGEELIFDSVLLIRMLTGYKPV
jgi:hypothetical protein